MMTRQESEQKAEEGKSRRIIIQMASSDEKRRREAEQQLTEQGLNTVEHLRKILNAEHRRRRKLHKPLEAAKYMLYFLLSFLYLRHAGQEHSIGHVLSLFFASVCILWFASFCISIPKFALRIRFDHGMARALSKFDDVRLIGPLLEVYLGDGKELLEPVLIRLLPRLQASDAPLLQEYHRNKLYFQLSLCYGINAPSSNTELVLAVLKALEQIGDEKAIQPVEKVAEKAKNPRIRAAAADCLAFLKVREAEGKYQLLRASGASTTDLLRPTTKANTPSANTLLRSSSSLSSSEDA